MQHLADVGRAELLVRDLRRRLTVERTAVRDDHRAVGNLETSEPRQLISALDDSVQKYVDGFVLRWHRASLTGGACSDASARGPQGVGRNLAAATAAGVRAGGATMRLGKTLGWTHADCRGREPDIRQVQGEQIAREAADAVPQALAMIAGPS